MAWKVSFGSWRPNSACFKRIWTKPCLHCLVDIKAKDFFLESTDVTSREALEMLHRARKLINSYAKAIDASGNRFPRNAWFTRGPQPVSVRAQGCTGNQKLCSKG